MNPIKTTLGEILEKGNLKITVDLERVIPNDCGGVNCPKCGLGLSKTIPLIESLASRWMYSRGEPSELCIRDAKGPLSLIVGMPFIETYIGCPNCGKSSLITMQLGVIS
jgi:predicted RNA-binding Zn-ribbon protein involved in translation (DUF1610 family)